MPLKLSVPHEHFYEGLYGQDSRQSLIASIKGDILLEIGNHLLWQDMLRALPNFFQKKTS